MKRKPVHRMSKREIAEALQEDGYRIPERELPFYLYAIWHGAREGTLDRTPAYIVNTAIAAPFTLHPANNPNT